MSTNKELIKKALTASDPGSNVVQTEVDKVIAQIIDYKNPLRQNLPRKPGSGDAYYGVRRTPNSAGDNRAYWVNDTDSLTETTGTYDQFSYPYKTVVTKGKVTRKLQAIGKSYTDILTDEIEAKAVEYQTVEEDAYFNANLVGATDTLKPQGFLKQCTDAGRVIFTDGAGSTASSLTLMKMDELIDTCKGEPDALLMSKKGRRILSSLLQQQQRWIDKIEIKGGFKVISYNNIPIIVTDGILDTYSISGGAIAGTTDGTETLVCAVNFTEFFISELTPVTFQMLAKVSTQYDEFEVYCDQSVVIRNYLTCAALAGFND